MPTNLDENLQDILKSSTYKVAYKDVEFLSREDMRSVRMQLELRKPEIQLQEQGVLSTIVVFGGTQIIEKHHAEERLKKAEDALNDSPQDAKAIRTVERAKRVLHKHRHYNHARDFSKLVSSSCQVNSKCDYVITTGGGPGIMEAANRGAYDVRAKNIGLNITLPHEQAPNPYITPELCFEFQYFALRKMHFLLRAKALVIFPGGFGTLDELFDALTLRQTNRMQEIPIILFDKEYWSNVINFQFLADEGVISDDHLNLIDFAETPEEAWQKISEYHNHTT